MKPEFRQTPRALSGLGMLVLLWLCSSAVLAQEQPRASARLALELQSVLHEQRGNQLYRLYRELQRVVHPDRYANATDQERRLSMQGATRVNEAFQVLKDPIARARYLLLLNGIDLDAEKDNTTDAAFLMEQLELILSHGRCHFPPAPAPAPAPEPAPAPAPATAPAPAPAPAQPPMLTPVQS